MIFRGTEYPKEADVRKAIELTVSQIDSGTAGEKADAKFGAILTLYSRKFLPSESHLLELKKKLHKVFPADGALVDAFTVAREDEIDEINLLLKAAATPENINLLAQRLTVPVSLPLLLYAHRPALGTRLSHFVSGACVADQFICALPFPASAGSCPPLFGRFTGTSSQSDFSSAYVPVVRLCAVTDLASPLAEGALEISRFSCMLCLSMCGL